LESATDPAPDLAFGVVLELALFGTTSGAALAVARLGGKFDCASDIEVRFMPDCFGDLRLDSASAFVFPLESG